MQLLITFLFILFALSAIVLITVILLQEGKGGGFGEALGGAGQQTFGVGSAGLNKFTAITAGVFLGTALTITILNRIESGGSVISDPGISAPLSPGGAPGGATGGATGGAGSAGGGVQGPAGTLGGTQQGK